MKNSHPPSTDIIIVTYNAKNILTRCLRSVIRHTRDLPYQLTVLDNASTDGTSDHLKRYFGRECNLLQSGNNLGFSGGANLALRRTRRPWVVLLDDDAEVTPGWLRKLHALARKHPRIGIIGGKVVFPNNRIFCAEYNLVPYGPAGWGERDRGQRDYTREVDALPGPCWLLPRKAVDRIGPFDERFFPSQYEDIDYCLRARLAGYKVFYHGKVRVVHSNVYRIGSTGTLWRNEIKFFKKWKKVLKRSPFCPLDPDDRLIAEGARLFEKETFCPTHPILDRQARCHRWLPPALYRGIAFLASGEKKSALREFRSAAGMVWKKTDDLSSEKIHLHRVLSVYFSRLGIKKEAARHAACLLDVLRTQGSPVSFMPKGHPRRTVTIRLHGWRIRIVSDEAEFLRALKSFLPYDWRRSRQTPSSGNDGRLLEILFSNKTAGSWKAPVHLVEGLVPSYFSACGIYRIFDPRNLRAFVVMNDKKYLRDNWFFHASFLWSLEHLLRLEDASFVHGALLGIGEQGILLLGEKGAGKSTLSTACVSQGYRYFSDEHPILEIKGDRILGKSFISPIALPAVSAGNFNGLRSRMTWSNSRQKFLLEPDRVWPDRLGVVTRVTKVVFPRFVPGKKLSARKLDPPEFLERLLKDEYLAVELPHEKTHSGESIPRRLATLLSRKASGFAVDYGPGDILRMPRIIESL